MLLWSVVLTYSGLFETKGVVGIIEDLVSKTIYSTMSTSSISKIRSEFGGIAPGTSPSPYAKCAGMKTVILSPNFIVNIASLNPGITRASKLYLVTMGWYWLVAFLFSWTT